MKQSLLNRKQYSLALTLLIATNTWADSEPNRKRSVEVEVVGEHQGELQTSGEVSQLLKSEGVDFYSAGGISKLPVIRGLNDDRIRLLVDGAETTSACANHMNPALSYIDSSRVVDVDVMAGITPVSVGGDSIAGTIVIHSEQPVFSDKVGSLLFSGSASLAYKSNNINKGLGLNMAIASHKHSLEYTGSLDEAESYEDAAGHVVLDTLYKSVNHSLTYGTRGEKDTLTLKLNHQQVPYQGFPNQYMDMVDNVSNAVNLNYIYNFEWGVLDSRVTWRNVSHEMGFFTEEKPGTMPMITEGVDTGYTIKLAMPLSDNYKLSFGNEYHRFTLDDYWPSVDGHPMMGPDTFVNISDGVKTRMALWAESEFEFGPKWNVLTGLRYESVNTDAGDVQPYNSTPPDMMGGVNMGGHMMGGGNPDLEAAHKFNMSEREQADNVVDLTLLARYSFKSGGLLEFGYARKTRTPNLYERYSWGRGTMAMTMIGWFGDTNGYTGNITLSPETAHTLGASLQLGSIDKKSWSLNVSPYITYVDDYIDAQEIDTFHPRNVVAITKPKLQFINTDAELFGADVLVVKALWNNASWGEGVIKTNMSYTRGRRRYNGGDLYQIMPLNVSTALEQVVGRWSSALELEWVDNKDKVDLVRLENETDSYTLVNIHTRYSWSKLSVKLAVNNALDRRYQLPLSGVSYAQWKADGMLDSLKPLPGQGRSVDFSLNYRF